MADQESSVTMDMDGGAGTSTVETHILDLPDECLVAIMRCLNTSSDRIPISTAATVEHPLQCALVCKRLRALTDAAVCSLTIVQGRRMNARYVVIGMGNRFKQLTSLTIATQIWPGQHFVALASGTPHLERLDLQVHANGIIPSLAEALSKWTSLVCLNIRRHFVFEDSKDDEMLVSSLCTLSSLQHLRFETELPMVVERLEAIKGLQTLHLDVSELPLASSGHFPRVLRELELRNCKGTRLPSSLCLFTYLSALTVYEAESLTMLPETLMSLSLLTRLEVQECELLTSFPNTLGLTALNELQLIDCEYLEGIPENLTEWRRLTKLEVKHCDSFERLPEDLSALSVLEELRVEYSHRLVALPRSLGSLGCLQTLSVRGCKKLIKLPDTIEDIAGLLHICLAGCDSLEPLPESLGRRSNLTIAYRKGTIRGASA